MSNPVSCPHLRLHRTVTLAHRTPTEQLPDCAPLSFLLENRWFWAVLRRRAAIAASTHLLCSARSIKDRAATSVMRDKWRAFAPARITTAATTSNPNRRHRDGAIMPDHPRPVRREPTAKEEILASQKAYKRYRVKRQRELRAILGARCPRLELRLYEELSAGPLSSRDLLELLWAEEYMATHDSGKWVRRLRRLVRALNDRLLKRRIATQVIQPEAMTYELRDGLARSKDKWNPAAVAAKAVKIARAERRAHAASKRMLSRMTMGQIVAQIQKLLAKSKQPKGEPITVAGCERFLRNALASGPLPSAELRESCLRQPCSDATYRRALKRVGAKTFLRGYGATGRWYTALPDAKTNATDEAQHAVGRLEGMHRHVASWPADFLPETAVRPS